MVMKKTVTLNPGESRTVAFTFTPTAAGVHSVSVDGLSGSFTVLEAPVAEFEVSNLTIEPPEIYVGETVNVSLTVTNIGDKTGSYEVVLEII